MAGLGAQHPGLGAPPRGRPRVRGASEVRGRGCVLCSVRRKSQLWWRLSSSLPSAPSSSPWLSVGPWAGMGVPRAQDTEGHPLPLTSHRTQSRWEGSGERVPLCHSAPGRPAQPTAPPAESLPSLGPLSPLRGWVPSPSALPLPFTRDSQCWGVAALQAGSVHCAGGRVENPVLRLGGESRCSRGHCPPSALRPAPARCPRGAGDVARFPAWAQLREKNPNHDDLHALPLP